jgi:hypothetical protein
MAAFPTLLGIPANVFLQIAWSSTALNGFALSFAPTISGGANFDLTNAASYVLKMDNGETPGSAQYISATVANTKLSGTTTGGSLSVTSAAITTALTALAAAGALSGRFTITAVDSIPDNVLVGSGTWSAAQLP